MMRQKPRPEDVIAVVKQSWGAGYEITIDELPGVADFARRTALNGELLLNSKEATDHLDAVIAFKHAGDSLLELSEIRNGPHEETLRELLLPLLLRAQLGEAHALLLLHRWDDAVTCADHAMGIVVPRPLATSLSLGFPDHATVRCVKAVAFAASGQQDLAAAEAKAALALSAVPPSELRHIQLLLDYIECSAQTEPVPKENSLYFKSLMQFFSHCKAASLHPDGDGSQTNHQEVLAEREEAVRLAFVALGQEDQLLTVLQAIKSTPSAYLNDKRPVVRQLAAAVGEVPAAELQKPCTTVVSSSVEELEGWLVKQELEPYRDALKQLGVDSIGDLKWLQESDLEDFAIPPFHRKKIVEKMKE